MAAMESVELYHPIVAEMRPAVDLLVAAYEASSTNAAEINECARVHLLALKQLPSLDEVDLLDYPWLVHELGHSAFKANNCGFNELSATVVDEAIAKRKARTISLQGAALRRSRNVDETMRRHWGPHHDRNSWSLEMGVDLFAVWHLGPAYGAAFLDVVTSPHLDVFKIDRDHPPYAIRARVLEGAMRRLGWQKFAEQLADEMSRWRGRDEVAHSAVAEMSDDELLNRVLYGTLEMLERCGVPRCTESALADARSRIHDIDHIEFGRTLLLCAHVAHESLTDGAFDDWHRRVVSSLADQVTQ